MCIILCRLNNHRACVNGIAWAPHSSCHICTAGDDHQALIWDIQQMPRAIEDPILAYTAAEGEINQIQWGATQPDWIGEYQIRFRFYLLLYCTLGSFILLFSVVSESALMRLSWIRIRICIGNAYLDPDPGAWEWTKTNIKNLVSCLLKRLLYLRRYGF
jgi:hypothetical protein